MTPEEIRQDLADAQARWQKSFQQMQCTAVSDIDAVIASGKKTVAKLKIRKEPPKPVEISPESVKTQTIDLIGSESLRTIVNLLPMDLPQKADDPEREKEVLKRAVTIRADLEAEGEDLSPEFLGKLTTVRDEIAETVLPQPFSIDLDKIIGAMEGDEDMMSILMFGALVARRIVESVEDVVIAKLEEGHPRIAERLRAARPVPDRLLEELRANHAAFDRLLEEIRSVMRAA